MYGHFSKRVTDGNNIKRDVSLQMHVAEFCNVNTKENNCWNHCLVAIFIRKNKSFIILFPTWKNMNREREPKGKEDKSKVVLIY